MIKPIIIYVLSITKLAFILYEKELFAFVFLLNLFKWKYVCICLIYTAHGRGVYICGRLFRIHAHAEFFGLFHLFTLFLEEFDYIARVQHVLHITRYS